MATSRPRRIVLASLLALVLALAAGAAWLLTRDSTLQWAVQRLVAVSGGSLSVGRVEGSLPGPIRLSDLRYRDRSMEVRVDRADIEWTATALLARRLRVTRLALGEVRVTRLPGGPPSRAPADLGLPLAVAIDELTAQRIVITSPSGDQALQRVASRFASDGSRHRIDLTALESEYGGLRGQVALGARSPFPLEGEARFTPADARVQALAVRVSGSLLTIRLDAVAESSLLQGEAQAVVAPFEPQPMQSVQLALRGLDPSQWDKELPAAQLNLRIDAQADPAGKLQGSTVIENARPGTLDAGRIPLTRLESRLAGRWEALQLEDLRLALGAAGELRGRGHLSAAGVGFDLATQKLDLQGLHHRIRATALAGSLSLGGDAGSQTLSADLTQQGYRLRLRALRRGDTLELKSASVSAGGGSLDFSGTLALTGTRPFSAQGTLRQFDPSALGNFPAARINASLSASGRLEPQWQASLGYEIADSRYNRHPVSGRGELTLAPAALVAADAHLQLGANRLALRGSFGAPGDRLHWTLDAAQLDQLGAGVSGSAEGSGVLAGTREHPSLEFQVRGRRLEAPGRASLRQLEARGRLEAGAAGTLQLSAAARGVGVQDLRIGALNLDLTGTRAAHTLSIEAKDPALDLSARLEGALAEGLRWSGRVLALESTRPHPLRLTAPAALAVSAGSVELGPVSLTVAGAQVAVDTLSWQRGALASRGRFSRLPAALLLRRQIEDGRLESTLLLSGAWDMEAAQALNGTLRLWRESGDLGIAADTPVPLGLTGAALEATARDNALSLRFSGAGSALGTLAARLDTRVARRGNAWVIPPDAPLDGELQSALPSLAWVGPLLYPGMRVAGSLGAQFVATGTLARPRLTGGVAVTEFAVHQPELGIFLSRGSLNAELQNERVLIREGVLRTRGEGKIEAQGEISLEGTGRLFELRFTADKLALIQRPDRQVQASGQGTFWIDRTGPALEAKLRADSGLLDLGELDRPGLSDDVIIEGRSARAESGKTALRLDVEFDLGDKFKLQGAGIDARLAGVVKVKSDERGEPAATGTLRLVRGTYTAYGTVVQIERGFINFTGPLTNPGLDILALRKNQAVEAGVAVTGTTRSPRVRLVSNPAVPDREKLSWLVFGRGGEPVDVALGDPQRSGGQALALGRQISKRVYVAYERSTTGTENLFKIFYTLSRRWSLRSETGSDNAIRLFYALPFD